MTTVYGLTLRVGPGAKGRKVAYQLILSATTVLSRSPRPRKSMKPDQGNTASESWSWEDLNPRWIATRQTRSASITPHHDLPYL